MVSRLGSVPESLGEAWRCYENGRLPRPIRPSIWLMAGCWNSSRR